MNKKSNSIDLDGYLTLKEKPRLTVFLFLLEGEYPHLDNETSWVHYCRYPTYLVRLSMDEFHMMDIGIHPKTIVTKKGRELLEFKGLVSLYQLMAKIENM